MSRILTITAILTAAFTLSVSAAPSPVSQPLLALSGLASTTWDDDEITVVEHPVYTVAYPKTWQVAKDAEAGDKVITFMVGGSDSYITIRLYEAGGGIDEHAMIASVLETLDGPLIETISRENFSTWGSYNGQGRHLKGMIAGFFPGGARIFTAVINEQGILITEVYYSEDLDEAMPGYDLVQQSFVLK